MDLTADIFNLDGELSGEGLISGVLGGHARAGLNVSADLCHGIDLGVQAEARAQINAALTLVAPAIMGRGDAYARAGLSGQLRLDPNLFKRFGLNVGVAAFAEAGVAGRLGLGLNLKTIGELAAPVLADLPYQLFLVFLEEVRPEAGAWGMASVSAMARADFSIQGSLAALDGNDPGFHFQLGGGVGIEAGVGFGFYCGTSFNDVRRFYGRSVDLIVAELRRGLEDILPQRLHPALELFDLTMPLALETAFELGLRSAQGSLGTPQEAVAPFVESLGSQLQRWLLEKIVAVASRELADLIQQHVLLAISTNALSGSQRASVRSHVEAIVEVLSRPSLRPPELQMIVSRTISIAGVIGAGEEHLHRPLSLLWTAVSLGFGVRGLLGGWQGSFGGSLFGAGGAGSGGGVALPDAPAFIKEEYSETLNRVIVSVGVSDAIDYLIASGVSPLLERNLPEARLAIEQLCTVLQTTPGELVETILQFASSADMSRTALYMRWRDWLRTTIEDQVLANVIQPARAAATGQLSEDLETYLDHVAEPSLRLLVDYLFHQLDRIVSGAPAGAPNADEIATGCSVVVYHILARNLVTFDHIVGKHILSAVSGGFDRLEARFRGLPNDTLVTLMMAVASQSLPGHPGLREQHRPAVQELLGELAAAGKIAFGPTVWTPDRIDSLRQLRLDVLLSIDGDVDYAADAGAFRSSFEKLAECAYIPNLDACRALLELQLEIMADEAAVVVGRVLPALAEFYLRITVEQLLELDRQLRNFIEFLVGLVDQLAALVNELLAAAKELGQIAREYAQRAEAILAGIQAQLTDPERRQAIRDRLRSMGIANVIAATAEAPEEVRAAALLAFEVTFDLPVTQGLIDLALETIGQVAGDLVVLLQRVDQGADAVNRLGEALVTEAAAAIPGGKLIDGGLSASDVGEAIKQTLITTYMRQQINEWLAVIDAEQVARAAEDAKRLEAVQEHARLKQQEQRLHDSRLAGPVNIRVLSPGEMGDSLQQGWVYPSEVPVTVVLSGAVNRAFIHESSARRIQVALNGTALIFPSDAWTFDQSASELVLQTVLKAGTHPLEAGTNVLEVSVVLPATPAVDGHSTSERTAIVFVMNPDEAHITGPVSVRLEQSQFDTPGDDHSNTDKEFVVIEWAGTSPLPLRGWRLQDFGDKHRYYFPDIEVQPHSTIRIVTGGHPDQDTVSVVHMGRSQAVWNNRGDIVYLIDDRDILRAFLPYGTKARELRR